jgi:hypothetical protein
MYLSFSFSSRPLLPPLPQPYSIPLKVYNSLSKSLVFFPISGICRGGLNAFHMAVRAAVVDIQSNKDVLKLLLNNCPSGEWYQMDRFGESALHIAARERGLSAISLLVQHGFCMYTLDNSGQTAFDLACMLGEEYVVWLFFLLDYDLRRISVDCFRNGVAAGHWRTALMLVAFGLPIDRSIFWECFDDLLRFPKPLLLILGYLPHILQEFLVLHKSLVDDMAALKPLRELARPKKTPMMLIDTIVIQCLGSLSQEHQWLCFKQESDFVQLLYHQHGGSDKIPYKILQQLVDTWHDLVQMAVDQWPELWNPLAWFAKRHRLVEDLAARLNPGLF